MTIYKKPTAKAEWGDLRQTMNTLQADLETTLVRAQNIKDRMETFDPLVAGTMQEVVDGLMSANTSMERLVGVHGGRINPDGGA